MTLTNCEICHNDSGAGGTESDIRGAPGVGAGIYNEGKIYESSITNCTISYNSSPKYGGGSNRGGGIYNKGLLTINHCTIYRNILHHIEFCQNPYGGGICNYNYSLKIKNTIVAANQTGAQTNGPDLYGIYKSLGYNLVGIDHGFQFLGDKTGNLLGVDPKLENLGVNGGLTPAPRFAQPPQTRGASPGRKTVTTTASAGRISAPSR